MMTNSPENQTRDFQVSVAMTVTLISFGMLFGTMFLGYTLVRSNSQTWPPTEIENLPMFLPFLSTLVIGLSSWTYNLFEKKESHRNLYWLLTVVLGFAFLALQVLLWSKLQELGILAVHGQVPSMVYAFTWVHAGHIVLALSLVLWLGYFIFRKPQGLTKMKLLNVGKFWHFLSVIWLLMYLMLFVL